MNMRQNSLSVVKLGCCKMLKHEKLVLGCMWMLMILNSAGGDIAKDREKCENEVVGLATCLPYVSGEAKAPASDCCGGFKQVLRDSRECICLLIKDRNDPSLGLKINATLALSLPARCKTPLNESITDCPTILHLPPNSPDAKVFEDFAKSGNKSITPTTGPGPASSSSRSFGPPTFDQKSDGGEKKKIWLEAQMLAGSFIAMAALDIFINS